MRLILRNNIDERTAYRKSSLNNASVDKKDELEELWNQLDDIEKAIISFISSNDKGSRSELEKYTKKSRGTVIKRLNNLMDKGIITVSGDIHDPNLKFITHFTTHM